MSDTPDFPESRPAKSVRGLAKMLQMSPTTVFDVMREQPGYAPDEDGNIVVVKRWGLDGKARPSRRVDTSERDDQIRELRADGKSIRAIAGQVNCSVGTVHRVLSR